MSQSVKQGHTIEQFKGIRGLDSKQAEAIKNAASPVMRISLPQDQEIQYIDMNGQPSTIRNTVPHAIDIVIFGSNIMYNEHEVKVTFKA